MAPRGTYRQIAAELRGRIGSGELLPGALVASAQAIGERKVTWIVDFKSSDRAQAEDVTRDQLHVYALGYEELTGEDADLIEVLNLDEAGKSTREEVEESLLSNVRSRVRESGDALRTNMLPRLDAWCNHCDHCDLAALCRDKPDLSLNRGFYSPKPFEGSRAVVARRIISTPAVVASRKEISGSLR